MRDLASFSRKAKPMQDRAELEWFLDLVHWHNVKRYLEIGCRYGDTFKDVASVIGSGGYGVAVDQPWQPEIGLALRTTIDRLPRHGFQASLLVGSSQDLSIVSKVKKLAPFDLVLIDADHRYEGVKADWENYGPMASIVAFHDVFAPEGHKDGKHLIGVPQLWNEIKDDYRHEEFETPGSKMGYGVLYRN